MEFEPKIRGSVTYLLIEQQVHAELHQTYARTALRLETMKSVQDLSQWRVDFAPQTQSLVLHSLKILRGGLEIEHLALDRIQFLQMEAGLGGLIIDGRITLLLLLEDVSPGDVLEWSYTLTSHPRILPEFVFCLFTLPPGVEIGKYKFVVHHGEQRVLKWKSSQKDLAPSIKSEGAEASHSWFSDNFSSPAPEDSTPVWQLDFPWIQISDCPDWQTVARALQNAWKADTAGDGLTRLMEEIKSSVPDLSGQINRAIEIVQDGFRYLSVNLEMGGQIPAAAETVVRRRYGDCKDKAFLLVQLLRALGIKARPVLVNAFWQQSISTLLPSPNVFNHVVVEFEVENEKRWVDATIKSQGGGALGRPVTNFGFGLPIDDSTTELAHVPKASLPAGSLDLKESFILDTAGNSSYLAIVMKAKGVYAETLRDEIANEGIEAVAKKRLQFCANRFSTAKRIGQMEHGDAREINEFVLAEVFEISGFLQKDRRANGCVFSMQSHATGASLVRPSAAARRNPFALPFPSNINHTVEIIFAGLQRGSMRALEITNPFFSLSRRMQDRPGFMSLTFSFNTKADMVPPRLVKDHRKQVESAWQASSFEFHLPLGYARAHKRSDFGALPALSAGAPARHPPAAQTTAAPSLVGRQVEEKSNKPADKAERAQQIIIPLAAPLPASSAESMSSPPTPDRRGRPYSSFRLDGANRKCWWSFFILLGAMAEMIVAISLGRSTGFPVLTGGIALLVIPTLFASLTLAGLGFRECARQPGRYQYGRMPAVLVLVVGLLFGLSVAPAYVRGYEAARAKAKARDRRAKDPSMLDFGPLGFVYHPPGPPWVQVDARRMKRGHALLMQRDKTIAFSIYASKPPPGFAGVREYVVEDLKAILRRESLSHEIISEGEATHNGIVGWQMEIVASMQGHEQCYVDWVLATNGFAYHLQVWAKVELRSQVEQDADRMFSGFELTDPPPPVR